MSGSNRGVPRRRRVADRALQPRPANTDGPAFPVAVTRLDPWDTGRLPAQSARPDNAAAWIPNSASVDVTCGGQGGAYPVKWADGHTETWTRWYHTSQQTWFPSAVANGVKTDALHDIPEC